MARIKIIGSYESDLEAAREALAGVGNVSFQVGKMPDVALGCDAVIFPAFLAHDRYGGTPDKSRAQLLINLRGDAYPDCIIVTPAYSPVTKASAGNISEDRIEEIFGKSIQCALDSQELPVDCVALPIGALGLEGIPGGMIASALRRAIEGLS